MQQWQWIKTVVTPKPGTVRKQTVRNAIYDRYIDLGNQSHSEFMQLIHNYSLTFKYLPVDLLEAVKQIFLSLAYQPCTGQPNSLTSNNNIPI